MEGAFTVGSRWQDPRALVGCVLHILLLALGCSTATPSLAAEAAIHLLVIAMVNVPMHDAVSGSADCQPTVQPAWATAGFAAWVLESKSDTASFQTAKAPERRGASAHSFT